MGIILLIAYLLMGYAAADALTEGALLWPVSLLIWAWVMVTE